MSYHYYCVWDFMNLIKKLQITYTCCDLPFRPAVGEVMKQIRRFLNEINLEEETDEIEGGFISHFSYYNEGIKNLSAIKQFLNTKFSIQSNLREWRRSKRIWPCHRFL